MRLKKKLTLVISLFLLGCSTPPPQLVEVEPCEKLIVSSVSLEAMKGLVSSAEIGDVLISGGCYRDRIIGAEVGEIKRKSENR